VVTISGTLIITPLPRFLYFSGLIVLIA
jgi:hypothetical protein